MGSEPDPLQPGKGASAGGRQDTDFSGDSSERLAQESVHRLAVALVMTAIEVFQLRRSAETEGPSSFHHKDVDIAAGKRYHRRPRKGRRVA